MNIARCAAIMAGLAMFGLAAISRPADAAPTITAKPAEVVFYTKSTTKQKTSEITWNADNILLLSVQVYYKTNGANETPFASGQKGTKVADFIKLNNTYEFCLWASNHTNKLTCTTVKTVYKKVVLDLGFIKEVDVTPRGHSVRIRFKTVRTSLPIVQLSKTAPKKVVPINDDDIPAFADGVEITSHFAGTGTSHETTFTDLDPNTEHFFVIAATDKATGLWFKVGGKFRTLKRRVAVTFSKVKIVDDSDDLSPGDLVFGFFMNGQNEPNGKPMTFGTHASTDSTKNANVSGSITNAPANLTLKAVGYDDDETEWVPIGPFIMILLNSCGTSAADPGMTEGENDCGEWTSGSTSLNLATLAKNAADPEKFSQSFKIQARPKGDDSEVAFDVTGTVSVTFVP
jgi:hypothetical protein